MRAARDAVCPTRSLVPLAQTFGVRTHAAGIWHVDIRRRAIAPERRRNDHRRCIERRILGGGRRCGPARPTAKETGCGRRQGSIWRRHDLQTAVAGALSISGEVSGHDFGNRYKKRLIDHDRRHHAGSIQTKLALDHCPRCVDAVDVHRNAWLTGNHNHRLALGQRGRRANDKKQSRVSKTHRRSLAPAMARYSTEIAGQIRLHRWSKADELIGNINCRLPARTMALAARRWTANDQPLPYHFRLKTSGAQTAIHLRSSVDNGPLRRHDIGDADRF